MEGELNIKMKYILRFLIFPISVIIMITGCSQDTTTITKAKILVGFGPSMDFCLININENGTVEYISCDINNANLYNENIVREIYEKKTIHLSKQNKIIVNELIQKIITNEPKEEIDGSDFVEIRALIENKVYNSVYYNLGITGNWFYDENLAELCYKLVELAPLKVGGKYASLRVPDEYK